MDKTKPNEALSCRPIGKKIVAKMKRHRRGKVVDIKDWVDNRTHRRKTAQGNHGPEGAWQPRSGFRRLRLLPDPGVSHVGTAYGLEGDGAICGYGLQSRRSVHAGRTAD